MSQLNKYTNRSGKKSPLVSNQFMRTVTQLHNKYNLNKLCEYTRDYYFDYFGFKTLEKSYLIKINEVTIERPQHLWLRVAIGIHGQLDSEEENLPDVYRKVCESYTYMSMKYFTHASPTLYNAGTQTAQLSSCFLLAMEDDSIKGIYSTLADCAAISQHAGGIGLHIHNIRATGSHIRGTNGHSNGIVPMLRVFNNTARYVDQCVTPDSVLYTTSGPIQIQFAMGGKTQLFTLDGTEPIENVIEHEVSNVKLSEIMTIHGTRLSVTADHPILALKQRDIDDIVNKPIGNTSNAVGKWYTASSLLPKDLLMFPVPTFTEDDDDLSMEDCYMYGVLWNQPENNPQFIKSAHCHISNHNVKDRIQFYLDSKRVLYSVSMNGDNITYSWINDKLQLPFRFSDFVSGRVGFLNEPFELASRWLNLPLYKCKHILKGWLEAQQFTNIKLCNMVYNASLQYLCMRCGVMPHYRPDRKLWIPFSEQISTLLSVVDLDKKTYIHFPKNEFYCDGNFIYCAISRIGVNNYTGMLYDLQMNVEHNYMLQSAMVHNGGGKRHGSFAIYIEPWHADIEAFLELRKNHGSEDTKARDLFYALWMPDLFMERVQSKMTWTLMCPDQCPGLSDVYGDEFVKLYEQYEKEGRGRTIDAQYLWWKILDAQMETGTPYIVYKDAVNHRSNQKNVGIIKSSNLCTEIVEYSDKDETAVCNLASIGLPTFVYKRADGKMDFNYQELHKVTQVITENLNRVIDINFYPTEKTERSNKRHRPLGIGVQGLADVIILLDYTFDSTEARILNTRIFETIYHASLTRSNEISIRDGPYSTFAGSPASKGILQFDMWPDLIHPHQSEFDWNELKEKIKLGGIRNSLLTAVMPTASTSQILGFNECIEPFTSNIYTRKTLAGDFVMVNKYLMRELISLGVWSEAVKNNIIANQGSIKELTNVPQHIKNKYKTVWELSMKTVIELSADRGRYICQSQSMNLWQSAPSYKALTSMHYCAWKAGLKTGMYYLRRRSAHSAQQFSIAPTSNNNNKLDKIEEEEVCAMCSA